MNLVKIIENIKENEEVLNHIKMNIILIENIINNIKSEQSKLEKSLGQESV